MREATAAGRELLDSDDPGEALFAFLREIVEGQQTNRALFEAIEDKLAGRTRRSPLRTRSWSA